MKKNIKLNIKFKLSLILCLIIVLLLNMCIVASASDNTEKKSQKIAEKLLLELSNNNYSAVVSDFDETMKKLLQPAQIKSLWTKFLEQCGSFESIDTVSSVSNMLTYEVVRQKLFFKNTSLYAVVSIDTAGKVAGLHFLPIEAENNSQSTSTDKYQDANYVNKTKFIEEKVKFPDGIITGKLTVPLLSTTPASAGKNVQNKTPVVVLVHGSGPNDEDETIFNNKVFRDIAYGLSSREIAVLRYNKRTLVDKTLNINNLTVKEEVINDVITAIDLLSKDNRFNNIYVLGHSLGAYLLPRIASASLTPVGFISLSSAARPLPELIIEQSEYIYSLDSNKYSIEDKKKLLEQISNCKRVLEHQYTITTSKDSLPFGVPAAYWLDLQNYNPVEEFKKERRKILFLHGERDYQTTIIDFNLFKNNLDKPQNKFVLFPELNHLFQIGSRKSTPNEYYQKQNVNEKIINEIEKFIKQ